ncbi:MAG: lipopolysaccharide biosynthesis protein [Nanopusillaceae archaeon]|jgi:O-antigen/teichoic acid export membrane protein
MVKLVYIFLKKNKEKLLYNLSILDSFCKKNNIELICITKKENRDYILKIKKIINAKFYLVENEKDIRKIKFDDKIILIYNELNLNLKEIKNNIEKIEKNNIIIFKNRIFDISLINPFVVLGKNIRLYENFLLEYFINKRKYIESNYKIKNLLYVFFINFYIFLKKSFFILDKLLKRKFIKDYINEKIGLLSYKLITFLLVILLARILTPEFYGTYVTIYNFILLFSGFIGSSNIILEKYISENIEKRDEQKKYLKIDIYIKLLFSLISLIIIFILLPGLLNNIFYSYSSIYVFLALIISILIALDGIGFSILYSYLRIKEARNLYILEAILKFSFVLFLSFLYRKDGFIFGLLLAYLLFDLTIIFMIIRKYPDFLNFFKEKISKQVFKKYLSSIFYISLPPLLFNFYSAIDIQILRIFTTFKDVGYFYNALIITGTISSVFSIFGITLPRILRWEKEKIKNRVYKIVGIQLIINIILYGLLILISPYLITLFFGPSYILSAELLKYVGIILIIQSFSIFSLILYRSGYEKYYSIYAVTSSILSIILDLILISRFKLYGAVASAILGNIFNVLIAYIIYEKAYNNITSRSIS